MGDNVKLATIFVTKNIGGNLAEQSEVHFDNS